jgi:hypothetical protein
VHPMAQRLLNLLQLCHHPLVRRLSPDHERFCQVFCVNCSPNLSI